jgi:hypothetical protein
MSDLYANTNAVELQLDPDNREWEYDGDGNRIYKIESGYSRKTYWEEFKSKGMYHKKMGNV